MSDSIFRGNCQQAKMLNAIGEGIESLCETEVGGEGEPTKKTFPVRSQLTWFRLIHKYGSIRTSKISADDEQAEFEAEVFDEQGRFLQNARGTATYADDGVRGFKLIETAESRSVARALSGAGFGCQLNLGYFDEGEPGGPNGSKIHKQYESPADNNTNDGPVSTPADTRIPPPGTVNGQLRVAGMNPVTEEVHEPDATETTKAGTSAPQLTVVQKGSAETPVTAQSEKTSGRRRKSEVRDTPPSQSDGAALKASDADKNTDEQPEPVKKDASAIMDSGIDQEVGAVQDEEAKKPAAIVAEKDRDPAPEQPLTPAEKLAANTVYQRVKKQFDEVKANPTEIKNAYFTADDVSGNGKYINRQKTPTHMDAMELQHAIMVLEADEDSYKEIPAPLHENSERYGMTFGELIQDPTGTGKNLVAALSEMYRKDNALAFAAALICTKANKLVLVENPAA